MAEPRFGQRPVCGVARRQFSYHLRFRARVRQHVDEVEHNHVEVEILEIAEILQQSFAERRFVDFVVGEFVAFAETVELRLDQRRLIEVFPLLRILVDPQLRKHFLNLQRHQSGEYCVARILRGGRQDGGVEILFDVEPFGKDRLCYAPLVEAEIVDKDEKHLFPIKNNKDDSE